MRGRDVQSQMDQAHGQKEEVQLIANAHAIQIVASTIAQASRSPKRSKATQIVQQTDEYENQWCD